MWPILIGPEKMGEGLGFFIWMFFCFCFVFCFYMNRCKRWEVISLQRLANWCKASGLYCVHQYRILIRIVPMLCQGTLYIFFLKWFSHNESSNYYFEKKINETKHVIISFAEFFDKRRGEGLKKKLVGGQLFILR